MDNIKRADLAVMLVNLLGIKDLTLKPSFKDIEETAYYANYVAIAKELGIVNGDNKGNFNPNNNVKREDAMVMINNILKQLNIVSNDLDNTKDFKDASQISGYALESVNSLIGLNIISGSNGKIAPRAPITRAEMSIIIDKVYDILQEYISL